jgi:hypothetical protein
MTGWVIRQTFATHRFGQTLSNLANATRNVRKESTGFVDEQIDIDVNLYRRQFGEAFKQNLVTLEAAVPQTRAAAPRSSREAPKTGQVPKSAKGSSLIADLWSRV